MGKIISFIKSNKYLVLALCALFVYLSPNIFFQSSARFLIHDNLNSNVVWYKNLAESGKMFSNNLEIVPNSIGGIPRGCYPSEFNVLHILYLVFSPLMAYNINIILMHVLAFLSMYLFLRRYVFKYEHQGATVLVALCFSLLPFWPSGGAAITMQPLLLYAFLNIYNRDLNWKNWLIIGVIPFYSVLVFANLFFISSTFIAFMLVSIYRKKMNFYFIIALSIFSIASIVAEYRLFYMQFIEHFQSHRELISGEGTLNLKGVVGVSVSHFLQGQYHFIALQTPFIIAISSFALFFANSKKQRISIVLLLLGIFLISIVYVVPSWGPLAKTMQESNLLGLLRLRFYSLFPLLWFIVFSYSVKILLQKNKLVINYFIYFGGIAYCMGMFVSFNSQDYQKCNYAENSFYNTYINNRSEGYSTFDSYYKNELFKKVKAICPPGDYKVACLGITPEIVQYNGYNTIDGYFYYYPKSYNTFMKQVCEGELAKMGNANIKSHCIILSDDLNKGKTIIDSLSINFNMLKEKNVNYLFSNKQVKNDSLKSEQIVISEKGKLFIYSIN